MRRRRAPWAIIVVIVCLTAIAGGGYFGWQRFGTVPIDRILARPDIYDGRIVNVAGTVGNSLSILGVGYLEITDRTGTIWACKNGAVPRSGAKARVRGRVSTVLQIGPVTMVGLELVE